MDEGLRKKKNVEMSVREICDCGSQATAKVGVYFPQGEIVFTNNSKRKVLNQRAGETRQFSLLCMTNSQL